MHSDGAGKSLAISSSGGSFEGFANSNDGVNVVELLLLLLLLDGAFALCLLGLLLLPLDDVAVAVLSDDPGEKLLPTDLLVLGAVLIDTLSDFDDVRIGCNIPRNPTKNAIKISIIENTKQLNKSNKSLRVIHSKGLGFFSHKTPLLSKQLCKSASFKIK